MAVNFTLSEVILLHRKKARLTRLDLAELAGVGKTAVYDVEHGKLSLRFDTLHKILAALNISLEFHSPLLRELGLETS